MVVEGTFPKSDGDILYASEVNRFAKDVILISGNNTGVITSGTTVGSIIGSFLFPAGILSNPSNVYLECFGTGQTNAAPNMFVVISGASSSSVSVVNTAGAPGGNRPLKYNAFLGSPGSCAQMLTDPANTTMADVPLDYDTFSNFNSNAAFVISLGVTISGGTNNPGYQYRNIWAYGRSNSTV